MNVTPFKLERFFALHEFSIRYLLGSSDSEAWSMQDVIDVADEESRTLWHDLRLGYTESRGLPELREEVARLYRGVSFKDILIAAPTEAIFLTMHALLEPGDHLICTFPCYQCLYQVAEDLGCTVARWQPREENGWRFDLDDLGRLFQPRTKLLICNFPHNPTGALPTETEFRQIFQIAAAHGVRVFSDEMFRLLETDPERTLPSAVEVNERAIVLAGMSKVYGLAGLRLGWLTTRDQAVIDQLVLRRDYTTICTSAPSEVLALIALRARDKVLSQQRQLVADNLKLLDGFFVRQAQQLTWGRPLGGTVCFPRLVGNRSAAQLSEQALQAGVLVLSSELFDFGDNHIRIGFGRKNMPEALARFEEILDQSE